MKKMVELVVTFLIGLMLIVLSVLIIAGAQAAAEASIWNNGSTECHLMITPDAFKETE